MLAVFQTGSLKNSQVRILNLPFSQGRKLWWLSRGLPFLTFLNLGVGLNITPFLGLRSQQTPSEVIATQEIASERIHVKRAINKVKNFHIFNQVIPLSLAGSLNQMWTVCFMLANIQNPIISVTLWTYSHTCNIGSWFIISSYYVSDVILKLSSTDTACWRCHNSDSGSCWYSTHPSWHW